MWGSSTAEIQAELASLIKKVRVTSKSPLEEKRGLKFDGIVDNGNRKGWHRYYATRKAFELLHQEKDVTLNILLD